MEEDPSQKYSIKIENVVASTNIQQEIDLKRFASLVEDAEYDRERFPGIVYRTKDPKVAALIFKSGKIVCTGAKSVADVHTGLEKVFDKMRSMDIDVIKDYEVKVQNIVATAVLGSHLIDLNAIAVGLGLENVEYEPEMFPGLVYRLTDPKVVVLIFGSGKIVITGGKSINDATVAVEKIVAELESIGLL
ncbi:MAG: TATA-box-binding protein [Halobacteriota archaeon]|nr:TATA-box-binding protein [Halobacteriota archaeon]